MSGLELNKFAAAILIAGILVMFVGKIGDAFYPYEKEVAHHGEGAVEVSSDEAVAADVPAQPVDLGALLAAANIDSGKKVAKKCVACHTFEPGGANKVGPNLSGIVGKSVASVSGFTYSDAMKALGGKWSKERLYDFLNNPKKYVKGTKMAFAGVKKPEQLADLIAYLNSL